MEEFILWVVGVPLLGIGFYCFWTGLRRRSLIRARKNQIIKCRICGNLYQDRGRARSVKCPECGRMNDRGEARRLG